jgi:hypothetical protein
MSDQTTNQPLLDQYNAKLIETPWSMALIYFRFNPFQIETLKETGSDAKNEVSLVGNDPQNNPIATEWPDQTLDYVTPFSAFVSKTQTDLEDPSLYKNVYCMAIIPKDYHVERRTFTEANVCTLNLMLEDFPFDPANIRYMTAYVYSGIRVGGQFIDESKLNPAEKLDDVLKALMDPSDNSIIPIENIFNNLTRLNQADGLPYRDNCLQFAGFADTISADINNDGRTINIELRDVTGMLLDQPVSKQDLIDLSPSIKKDPIETILQNVCKKAHAAKGFTIHGIGFAPDTAKVPQNESKLILSKNTTQSRIVEDMSYWDLIIHLCQLCGLTARVELMQNKKILYQDMTKEWRKFICIPTLAIYTAEIAAGTTLNADSDNLFKEGKNGIKEFYIIAGKPAQVMSDYSEGHFDFWNKMPLCRVGKDSTSVNVKHDIGANQIPAAKVVCRDLDGKLISGWFPTQMKNDDNTDPTIDKINNIKAAFKGIKYWDSHTYKEMIIPGNYSKEQCIKIAENFYNDFVKGTYKMILKTNRYFFPTRQKCDTDPFGMVSIIDLQPGHAIAIEYPVFEQEDYRIKEFEKSQAPLNIGKLGLVSSDKQLATQIWFIMSVESSLSADGFEHTIELVNSWNFKSK